MQRRGARFALLLAVLVVPAAALGATAAAPANTALPTISGSAAQSAKLSASNGTWTGDSLSYTYQWTRCDSSGQSCANIVGATAPTYVLTADDVGSTVRVRVIATNSSGQASASSAATSVVVSSAGPGPVNTAVPTIGGTAAFGSTVTATPGTWTGTPAPTYAYQWEQCDASGASCSAIPGATGTTYTAKAGDVGATLLVVVTATNSSGSGSAQSSPTPIVGAGGGPNNSVLPAVSGAAQVGSTLTASNGVWAGNGTLDYLYEWDRCGANGGSCTPIDGANAQTYVVATADSGSRLRAAVTAIDQNGYTTATSALTAVVGGSTGGSGTGGGGGGTGGGGSTGLGGSTGVAGAPTMVVAPALSGLLLVGATVSTNAGGWVSNPGIRFAYRWYRCNAKGQACAALASRSSSYRLVKADVGHTVRSQVTASNASGPSRASSTPSGVVGAGPAVRLRGGRYSVPAGALHAHDRVVVRRVALLAGSRVRATVTDRRGDLVRGAHVTLAVRNGRPAAGRTARNGTVVLRLRSKGGKALHGAVAVTVRARTTAHGPSATRAVRLHVR